MRPFVSPLALIAIIGVVTATIAHNAAAQAPKPAKKDGLVVYKLHGVYLECKESQEQARKAIEKFPGVTELKIDPAVRLISMKLPPSDYVNEDKAPLGMLRKSGLYGNFEIVEPSGRLFKAVGLLLDDEKPKPADRVEIHGVFAGSAQSRKRIEQVLAPSKVTFVGDGPVVSLRIDGKGLVPNDLTKKLESAGFNASLKKK